MCTSDDNNNNNKNNNYYYCYYHYLYSALYNLKVALQKQKWGKKVEKCSVKRKVAVDYTTQASNFQHLTDFQIVQK